MPKTESIRARVDSKLKADAEAVLRKVGLTASDAIRLFYRQIALRKGLPFDVKLPNAATRQAIQELEEGKDLTRYDDFDDFRKAMTGGADLGSPQRFPGSEYATEPGPTILPSRIIDIRMPDASEEPRAAPIDRPPATFRQPIRFSQPGKSENSKESHLPGPENPKS
jgi:DNA-damage-inducible protein J